MIARTWAVLYAWAFVAFCWIEAWWERQRDDFLIGYRARRLLDEEILREESEFLSGSSYALIERDVAGNVTSLRRLDPRDVEPVVIPSIGPVKTEIGRAHV